MILFIQTIFAQASASPSPGGFFSNPMAIAFPLILVVMYFFMIRPQQKKAKDQQNFKDKIEKGMKVVTIGGLHGKISEVKDKTFVIETGGGIKMEFEKSSISMDMTKAVNAQDNPDKK